MPLYEYQCSQDGRFELIRRFSDPPLRSCPTCGQPVEKLFSSPAIQFKGTGWYITDYARKGKGGEGSKQAEKPDKAEKAESKSGSDTATAGSSSESKPSAPTTTGAPKSGS